MSPVTLPMDEQYSVAQWSVRSWAAGGLAHVLIKTKSRNSICSQGGTKIDPQLDPDLPTTAQSKPKQVLNEISRSQFSPPHTITFITLPYTGTKSNTTHSPFSFLSFDLSSGFSSQQPFPAKEHVSSTQHLLKVVLFCQQIKNISFSDGCLE